MKWAIASLLPHLNRFGQSWLVDNRLFLSFAHKPNKVFNRKKDAIAFLHECYHRIPWDEYEIRKIK